ncbi:MAG: hypothetical protein ACRC0G_17795 [Fusobacteriaceae bacterium]
MKEILNKLYVTTCGRIFLKESKYRSLKSFEETPTLMSTFKNFCKRNNYKLNQFEIIKTDFKNSSDKPLYTFKPLEDMVPFVELQGCISKQGYRVVCLNGKSFKWHRIIMLYFDHIDNHENFQVNHKNGDKDFNSLLNLEWCTSRENIKHAWETGLSKRKVSSSLMQKNKMISKFNFENVFSPETKMLKSSLKNMAINRGLNFDDFEFIKTDKNKTNHGLGYLIKR